jgi:hypothetical protein
MKKPRKPFWLRGFGTFWDYSGTVFGGEEDYQTTPAIPYLVGI